MSETTNVHLSVNPSTMRLSAFVLDNFGAPKLSELTECGASAFDQPANHLGSFILTSVFIKRYPDPQGRLILMFGRRLLNAINEYITGRDLLLKYVQKLPETNTHFLQALNATTHFEQCVGSGCQAALLFDRLVKLAKLPPVDDERWNNLRKIWNRSKHFDEDLEDSDVENAGITAPVWLTNHGLSSAKANIRFVDLHSFLAELLNLFTSAFASKS
jgi:hypothetical protein